MADEGDRRIAEVSVLEIDPCQLDARDRRRAPRRFFGSEGLYAYDMKGKQLWKNALGVLDAGSTGAGGQWETGSSPIIHDASSLIQADVQKDRFWAAFDVKNRS